MPVIKEQLLQTMHVLLITAARPHILTLLLSSAPQRLILSPASSAGRQRVPASGTPPRRPRRRARARSSGAQQTLPANP